MARSAKTMPSYFMKLVSNSVSMLSGCVLITPISSSRSAASLLKAWISPLKNFLLASRSAHQVLDCDLLELLGRLLDVGAHDREGLRLVLGDHVEGLEVAVDERLHRLRVFLDELRRAAEGVEHHRVLERVGDQLAGLGLVAHQAEIGLVGDGGVEVPVPATKALAAAAGSSVTELHVLQRQAVLLQHPRQREVRAGARRRSGDGLAFEVGGLGDGRCARRCRRSPCPGPS